VTDVPWGFKFVRLYRNLPLEAIPVQHPTQLYEALCYVVTFGLLLWLYYRRNIGIRRPGLLFGVGLIGIFLTRFLIEFIKEDQEAFEQGMLLNMGQLLSIPFIVFGIGITVWALTRPEVQPIVAKPRTKRA
jgi:prolipoprotein diacylglyceryltransferase